MPHQPESQLSDELWWKLPTKALSATLVILFDSPQGTRALLTVRSLNLKHYPGDTALPGGRAENSEDWWEAALREAWEEIGFKPENFNYRRLAAMPAHLSAHFLLVRPVVVHVSPTNGADYITVQDLAANLSGDEVACAYSLPLNWFLNKNNLRNKQVSGGEWLGNPWNFYVFKTEKPDRSWVFADTPQMKRFSRTAVVGLTAHIMVDIARWYYDRSPNFEHLDNLGNMAAIATAVEDGLFPVDISKV